MKRSELKRKTPLARSGFGQRGSVQGTAPPPHSPPPPRRKPMKRKRMKRTPRDMSHEFTEETKARARRRSGNRCEARSSVCTGRAAHFHHRKLKGMGGRSVDNRLENCLHVCTACHDYMHRHSVLARLMGWIVHSTLDPVDVPVRYGDGSA